MYSSLQPSRGIPGEGMATDVIGGPGSCSRSQEYTWRVTVSHSLGIAGPSRGLELGGARPRLELPTPDRLQHKRTECRSTPCRQLEKIAMGMRSARQNACGDISPLADSRKSITSEFTWASLDRHRLGGN